MTLFIFFGSNNDNRHSTKGKSLRVSSDLNADDLSSFSKVDSNRIQHPANDQKNFDYDMLISIRMRDSFVPF